MSKKFEDIAGWYLIANVKESIPYGEKKEIRKGTKHFAPNTKVYCSAPRWGDGYENIIVGGRHRGSSLFLYPNLADMLELMGILMKKQ